MTTGCAREGLRFAHLILRVAAGAFLCALGWLIVFFTSTPRTRRPPPELTDTHPAHSANPIDGEPLPHPLDFPPSWRVASYGPSERRLSGTPAHLAPYGERMDELDA